jgi:uncharacterized protein HemX
MDQNQTDQNANAPAEETPETTPETMPEHENSSQHAFGPTAGVVIVVVLLMLGALYYFWSYVYAPSSSQPTADQIRNSNDPVVEQLSTQSNSTSAASIEQDLNASADAYDKLDADMQNIDTTLNQ